MRNSTTLILLALTALIPLSGCCKTLENKYQACMAENENLQALFDATQQSMAECNSQKESLQQQLNAARNDLQSARSLAAQSRQPAQPTNMFPGEKTSWDQTRGTLTVTLEDKVLFDPGKVDLKSASLQRLNNIADVIRREYPDKEISVVGHTDQDPIKVSGWDDNWQLSTERSLAVTRYLIKQGVSPKKITAAGQGQFRPVSTTQKSPNRRVEIVVHMYEKVER